MPELTSRVALVTGATGGIGRVTARELARQGCHVVIVGRDSGRAEETAREIEASTGGRVDVLLGDLSVQQDVRRLAAEFRDRFHRLDLLVNNAGGIYTRRAETPDGIELTWALNHLAYFLLSVELSGVLRATPGARVVNVSSEAHRAGRLKWDDVEGRRRYNPWEAYAQSKLANVLFTRELSRRLRSAGVTVNAVHPGVVATGFGRNNGGVFGLAWRVASRFSLTVEEGARASLNAALSPDLAGVSGRYFSGVREVSPAPQALDDAAADRLWRLSEEMTAHVIR